MKCHASGRVPYPALSHTHQYWSCFIRQTAYQVLLPQLNGVAGVAHILEGGGSIFAWEKWTF